MPSRAGRPNKPKTALLGLLRREYPGYHPVVEMARVANDPKQPIELRFSANKEVAKYVTPQLKAVEHSGTDGAPIQHIISADPMSLEQWEESQKEQG